MYIYGYEAARGLVSRHRCSFSWWEVPIYFSTVSLLSVILTEVAKISAPLSSSVVRFAPWQICGVSWQRAILGIFFIHYTILNEQHSQEHSTHEQHVRAEPRLPDASGGWWTRARRGLARESMSSHKPARRHMSWPEVAIGYNERAGE